jgi:hypothetical protein
MAAAVVLEKGRIILKKGGACVWVDSENELKGKGRREDGAS